jgi:hypothetical protein
MSILNDLLTFDKMEGGKMSLELEFVNCSAFITSLAKPFHLNAQDKSITFMMDFSELSPHFIQNACIKVDHSKMGQVLRNLISNALKFTPDGGTVVVAMSHVEIVRQRSEDKEKGADKSWFRSGSAEGSESVSDVSDVLRVEVRDTGAGMSALDQTRLFGQYVQFNANRLQKGGGSGLGLWISKGITELHGGVIGGHSEGEGKGSVFYVELPVTIPIKTQVGSNGAIDKPKKTNITGAIDKNSIISSAFVEKLDPAWLGDMTTLSLSEGIEAQRQTKLVALQSPMRDSIPHRSPPVAEKVTHASSCGANSEPAVNILDDGGYYSSCGDENDDLRDEGEFEEEAKTIHASENDKTTGAIETVRLSHDSQYKHRSGVSSVSSHSSAASRASYPTDNTSLYGLTELLKKSIRNGYPESSLPRKSSTDFLSSVHPFMQTSIPYIQSLPSSRNSLGSSKFQSRCTSMSTTPRNNTRCDTSPPHSNSGAITPDPLVDINTPLYSSPFNSPKTCGKSLSMFSSLHCSRLSHY